MPYVFTPPQQAQVETLFQAGPTANQPGDFSPMYAYISTILRTGSPPPDSDPVVLKSRLWFDGAAKANAGSGVFSILIRDYTQTQGKLHFGKKFPTSVESRGIQEASNQVAGNVHKHVADNGWEVPSIGAIATNDASGVGQTLFSDLPLDTAFTNNAAWSGAVRFTLLGDDQTWRLIGPETSQVVDTFDDYRNLLFARESYDHALADAVIYSPHDAFEDGSMTGLAKDMGSYIRTCWASGSVLRTACQPTFGAMVKGTVVAPSYASVGMKLSSDRVLALMRSGYSVRETRKVSNPSRYMPACARQALIECKERFGAMGKST